MSWHLLDKVVNEVSKQSTIAGKWMSLLILLRIIALTRIAETLYSDEQAAFKCNTKQPGCENVCFNKFSPISHVRFWSFQLIIITNPPMVFLAFATHAVSKLMTTKGGKIQSLEQIKKRAIQKTNRVKKRSPATEFKISNERYAGYNVPKKKLSSTRSSVKSKIITKRDPHIQPGVLDLQRNNFESSSSSSSNDSDSTKSNNTAAAAENSELLKSLAVHDKINKIEQHIKLAYVVQSILRTILEFAFIVMHLVAFGFRITEVFQCSTWPCPNLVDCFVSRPQEKTTVLIVMFGISVVSFSLGIYEVVIFANENMGCKSIPHGKRKYKTSPTKNSGSDTSLDVVVKATDLPFIKQFINHSGEKTSSSSSSSDEEKSLTSINTADLEEMYEDMEIEVQEFDQGQEQDEFV